MSENNENEQNKIKEKIKGKDLIQQIIDSNIKIDQSRIHQDQEYDTEQIQLLLSSVQFNTIPTYNVQFTNLNDLIIYNNEEFIINQDERDPIITLFIKRLQKGFYFKPSDIFKIIADNQQLLDDPEFNTFYKSYDIFEFISICQNQKKLELSGGTQQKQQNYLNRTQIGRPISQNLNSTALYKSFIYKTSQITMDGIFRQPLQQSQTQYYLNYQFYSSEYIFQTIDKCGWGTGIMQPFNVKDLFNKITSQSQYIRAAAIALFHFDFDRCVQALKEELSRKRSQQLQTLLIAVQGLESLKLDQRPEFKNLLFQQQTIDYGDNINNGFKYELILKAIEISRELLIQKRSTFTDPYLRLMAEFIIKDNFQQYLIDISTDCNISIFDRVGLWVRFLSKEQINSLQLPNNLDSIILHGKSERSVQNLQNYLDLTGDLQLAGVLAAHLFFLDYPNPLQLYSMFQGYIDLLESLELYFERSTILCEVQNLEQTFNKRILQEKIQNLQQVAMACNYCKKSLNNTYIENQKKQQQVRRNQNQMDNPVTIQCPMCNSLLPKCMVCVKPFTIPNSQEQDPRRWKQPITKQTKQLISVSEAIVWCLNCKHGGHLEHIQDWFQKNDKCAIADCNCYCSNI